MNILFSTTRGYNVGDNFIYYGVINLLKNSGIEFNPVIFNRHPKINPTPTKRLKDLCIIKRHYDNSYDGKDAKFIDYVIFAGTPCYSGYQIKPLYNLIRKRNLRCSYLGVGGKRKLKNYELDVMKNNSDLRIVRDKYAEDTIPESKLMPCPALFCSKREKQRKKFKKIGLTYQYTISNLARKGIIKKYGEIFNEFDCEIICHTYEDLFYASKLFPKEKINYSSYAMDFLGIYDKFDFIVSPRIHGCGMASSLGIPNILVKHDKRASVGNGFKSIMCNAPEINEIIFSINDKKIQKISSDIISHKKKTMKEYLSLMKEIKI